MSITADHVDLPARAAWTADLRVLPHRTLRGNAQTFGRCGECYVQLFARDGGIGEIDGLDIECRRAMFEAYKCLAHDLAIYRRRYARMTLRRVASSMHRLPDGGTIFKKCKRRK